MSSPIRSHLSQRNLSVLSRAVHFRNLSSASSQVGLSQPQLSRLVRDIEAELGVTLLDRTSRRQSRWTPVAFKLAEAFERSERQLSKSIEQLKSNVLPKEVFVACLDGLASLAVETMAELVRRVNLSEVHLDVLDQNDLEERLLAGSLDLAWTSRYPGRRKSVLSLELGSQSLDRQSNDLSGAHILSSFEYQRQKKSVLAALGSDQASRLFVSNSLRARQMWFDVAGGFGLFPSAVHMPARRGETPVLLLGQGLTAERLWPELNAVIK